MLIPVALLAYESILTIEDEVELIWRRKLSIASVVFITNRIAASLYVVYGVLVDIDDVRRAFRIDHHHLIALLGVSPLGFLACPGSTSGLQLSPHLWIARGSRAFASDHSGL